MTTPQSEITSETKERATTLFSEHQQSLHKKIDRMFAALMLVQWIFAIAATFWLSPRTWAGSASQPHIHIWGALLLGGVISCFPIFCALARPGEAFTRHVIAIGQLSMSALLIHLAGGRIETHFHVFGSLAFLSFYRDWRVLITGTIVTALDHFVRGLVWPQSVYGIQSSETWRWLEHAGWVIFEDVFLIISCNWGLQEIYAICERDASLQASNASLETKVQVRTASLREANERLAALATTDPLTALPNHRALIDIIDKEIERSHRYNRPASLLFLDIDHFKALNDGCGHAVGDAALIEFGQELQKGLRAIDTLGRWGGEEFVILLPETDGELALEVAERLRASIASHLFEAGGGVRITCSLGAATYSQDALSRSELVHAADRAMYAAKKLGRNQVRAVSDPIVNTLDSAIESSREDIATQGTVEALARLVEVRDDYTGEHTEGVAQLASQLAKAMGLDETEARRVSLVARLHDIGKVGISDAILRKEGKLDEEEWRLMKLHPIIGADVVSHVPSLRLTMPGIRGHHERWDGRGYPDRLEGEHIPLAARIVAVADAYSAMTTDRPYRQARSHEVAIEELKRSAGTQFDPAIVEAFLQVFERATRREERGRAA